MKCFHNIFYLANIAKVLFQQRIGILKLLRYFTWFFIPLRFLNFLCVLHLKHISK